MASTLDALKQFTVVVSDSGDFESIKAYSPQDATTNPSLILAAVKQEKYARLIDVAVEYAKEHEKSGDKTKQASLAIDRLLVEFGREILAIIPGRVSTEVDASLSFDREATIAKAKHIIELYESLGVKKERVLIKIASTFEGIQAARELQKNHGINCNLTLLFSMAQGIACAEAGVTLISPFVGRVLDWYKAKTGKEYDSESDPGVVFVRKLYTYFKQHGHDTIVMGASFRNTGEIEALAGCDYLTISPALLDSLQKDKKELPRKLSPEQAKKEEPIPKQSFVDNQAAFTWELFNDEMAWDKLHEGIRKFAADAITLRQLIEKKL